MSRFTDLAGIHAEYLAAVAVFPFMLPGGASFPASSSLRETDSEIVWERGLGAAEVYFFWHNATVSAAQSAYSNGDSVEANRQLSLLEAAYSSPVRKAAFEDVGGYFYEAVAHAKNGDYSFLVEMTAGL